LALELTIGLLVVPTELTTEELNLPLELTTEPQRADSISPGKQGVGEGGRSGG